MAKLMVHARALSVVRPWVPPYQTETSELKSIAGTQDGACLSPCPWSVSHHPPRPPSASALKPGWEAGHERALGKTKCQIIFDYMMLIAHIRRTEGRKAGSNFCLTLLTDINLCKYSVLLLHYDVTTHCLLNSAVNYCKLLLTAPLRQNTMWPCMSERSDCRCLQLPILLFVIKAT